MERIRGRLLSGRRNSRQGEAQVDAEGKRPRASCLEVSGKKGRKKITFCSMGSPKTEDLQEDMKRGKGESSNLFTQRIQSRKGESEAAFPLQRDLKRRKNQKRN